jgi:hypothetical protein
MARALRAVLLWLMTMAIPVQGMAAFAAPVCAPGHHHAVHEAAHAAVAAHGAHAGVPEGMHASDHRPAAEAVTDSGPDAAGSGHDMLGCCSATCSMAMLVAMPTLLSDPMPAAAPLHPLHARYRGVTLAGLDRPPKLSLA